MRLLRGFEEPDCYRGGYVAIGNFDGVHRGHQSMVALLVQKARAAKARSVVLTFDPHPTELLRPESAPPRLSTIAQRAELLEACGVECVIVYPTDFALLNLTPEEFFRRIILGELAAAGLVEGPNFFFGRDRAGNIDVLRELCRAAGLSLDVAEPVTINGRIVSSSSIRQLLANGQVEAAAEQLGRPYAVRGTVTEGARRGRLLGFPTANLDRVETLLPADGIYAGLARGDRQAWPAAIHLGPNRTFAEGARKLEAHLLDFTGDLYGQPLSIEFHHRVRGVIRFDSAEQLQQQLRQDVAAVRSLVQNSESRIQDPEG